MGVESGVALIYTCFWKADGEKGKAEQREQQTGWTRRCSGWFRDLALHLNCADLSLKTEWQQQHCSNVFQVGSQLTFGSWTTCWRSFSPCLTAPLLSVVPLLLLDIAKTWAYDICNNHEFVYSLPESTPPRIPLASWSCQHLSIFMFHYLLSWTIVHSFPEMIHLLLCSFFFKKKSEYLLLIKVKFPAQYSLTFTIRIQFHLLAYHISGLLI